MPISRQAKVSRRSFLASGLASLSALMAACQGAGLPATIYSPPSADPVPTRGRGKVTKLGPNLFRAECDRFAALQAEQRHDDWCWAACAQMIRQYQGERVTQEQIAQRIRGAGDRQTATVDEIMLALNPDMTRDWAKLLNNRKITITPAHWLGAELRKQAITTDSIVQEISQGSPLVIGMTQPGGARGHACVAYGVTYSRNDTGVTNLFRSAGGSVLDVLIARYDVQQVDLVDPWPDGGGRKTIDASVVNGGLDFMISKSESRAILAEGLKAIQ